ncbi:11040_t:CDS:2 [Ambispora gerdemannii]|uniref:DASH complex subunit DUO1 n=1 Tax=Ambispora gerdemannii TaxID=144530 RepID=A0A9N9CDW8_9GLOM|nr:11040_t:CDS:2 [Ambispora gerdemannii]
MSLEDQEIPENSILNEDDEIWVTESSINDNNNKKQISFANNNDNYYKKNPRDFFSLYQTSMSSISLNGGNIASNETAKSIGSLDNVLPDELLTQEPESYIKALTEEYSDLVEMNKTFGKVNENLQEARNKLRQFTKTIEQTDKLLDLWINILSQSTHTQQLLANPLWEGIIEERRRIIEESEQEEKERQERERETREREERERQIAIERAKEAEIAKLSNKPKIKRGNSSRITTKTRGRRKEVALHAQELANIEKEKELGIDKKSDN